ncbi:MAG TPA: sigma-E factor negative regulatory protein [Noviherbaspirillum sp.]|jgi:sigma-E factor negative regulatory protein RseA|uniref:sigma-E factor negative regulatory protein n=1 Tax=Noviherbaspirillum sp. TaxID=1926288 RepID=UPI002DDD2918|nr:sigma-E factor negative regulatory protein [Noviherbaspirillum sp.]HEV2612048.1 sigma-E factor negative regulatory protein [Noviherbaspirillum sp.]
MNTKEMTQEQISALVDGELCEQNIDLALAALRQPRGREAWEAYHQIGDVLRSDDMAVELSPGFAARMAARLEAEPTVVAPFNTSKSASSPMLGVIQPRAAANDAPVQKPFMKNWAVPGMAAAAAVASVMFVASPQLLVVNKGEAASAMQIAGSGKAQSALPSQSGVIVAEGPEGVVLRDPQIDDYLMAHQRFSPSVYSSAQYARSATFPTASTK